LIRFTHIFWVFYHLINTSGEWLKVNGEAIYGTKPWQTCQNETKSNVYYTTKNNTLYVHFIKWPQDSTLELNCPIPTSDQTRVNFLGLQHDNTQLEWIHSNPVSTSQHPQIQHSNASSTIKETNPFPSILIILLPTLTPDVIPCQHAWVVAISDVPSILNDVDVTSAK
jgi:alpha-L-fucosidase